MPINPDKLKKPQSIFIIYMLASGILIMIFRFIFPGSEAPLLLYSRNWRFIQGFLEFFNLYPALVFSALVIPFGLASFEEEHQSFSELFFKRLVVFVIISVVAAVIYCGIFFLAFPIVKNSEENIRYKGELYRLAKANAQEQRNAGEWQEASQLIRICDQVWPNSPELAALRDEVEINLEKIQFQEIEERARARASLARDYRSVDMSALTGDQNPGTATQALAMSRTAFAERRYFDAHWLATLAGRLAIERSPEVAAAARLASEAWNMIASQAPNPRETRLHQLHELKLSGYTAMNTREWIRAFYIFQELLSLSPDDPDAANFLAVSERGAKERAFFIDEMEMSLGEILTGAVFSLPSSGTASSGGGRAVLRFSNITSFVDVAYGMGFEYMSFDANSRPLASVRARYVKLLPITLNEKQQILVLTHALEREDKNTFYDGEWLIGNRTPGGILLDISYDDFLNISQVRHGLTSLQINELFSASQKMGAFGYVPQIFQAEILNRLGSAMFFLPMAIIVIILGWRYRAKTRPRYLFALMLPILPVVFHGLVFVYRALLNGVGIWLVLSVGFIPAVIIYVFTLALTLFISLLALAAQQT
ncbi:MAG: hypothetical protein LBU66_06180 [Treponema sp.]|nr:hypothetical protein [Treponema sp.]